MNNDLKDLKDQEKEAKIDYKEVRSRVKKGFKKAGFKFKNKKGRGMRTSGKQFNDVSWYTKNKTIIDAFAKLPFNYIVGNTIPNMPATETAMMPVIFSFNVDWCTNPASNLSHDGANNSSVINIIDMVAMIIYGEMRRNNSGSTNNIEYLDVLISNLIASIDIYANVHYIHRIFRTANSYSWKNRSIPRYIFSDHWNINYDDFIRNQALYRGRFDTLIAKAQTIRTLANFPFIDAIKAQFSDIFKDTDTDTGREELIVSAKPFHHIYDPAGTETNPGGTVRLLQAKDVPEWDAAYVTAQNKTAVIYTGTPRTTTERNNPYTLSDLLSILDAQIEALITDSDFNLIQADLEKAFGSNSGYIVVDPVTEVQPITPVYSGEFMTMFHNGLFYELPNLNQLVASTRLKAYKSNTYVNQIYQTHVSDGKASLKADMGWWTAMKDGDSGDESYDSAARFLDSDQDDPSVDDIVIMTRYRTGVKLNIRTTRIWHNWYPCPDIDVSKTYLAIVTAGSNFITWGGNITIMNTGALTVANGILFNWNNTKAYNVSEIALRLDNKRQTLLTIEKCPTLPVTNGETPFGEINNIRLIPASELLPIHEACFLSLWNLPDRTNI